MPDPIPPLPEFADDELVVDVCAVAAGELALFEFADDEVDVDVCADELPAPESPAAVLAVVDVVVEALPVVADGACAAVVVAPDGLVVVLPAEVAEVVPVFVCALEPLEPALVSVEVVAPV
jgi:hypothetical protein